MFISIEGKKMTKILSITMVMALVAMTGMIFAQEVQKSEKAAPQEKITMVTGEIIDMSCYATMGAKGQGHKACALECAKNGHALGLLEDGSEKVYTIVSPPGVKTQELLMPFIAEHVAVKGTIIEKGQSNFFKMETIEKAKGQG